MGIPFMRLLIEKPSDAAMRFFTPELYRQFNSANEEEADQADAAWESALQHYQFHLREIWDKLPSPIRKLTERCLHDAELLACHTEIEPLPLSIEPHFPGSPWLASEILSLKSGNEITTLIYTLWDRPRESPALSDWPFSTERKHWLYEELDVVDPQRGLFVQRILFSDGAILEIPFVSILIHRFML